MPNDFIATWQAKAGAAEEMLRILPAVVSETRQFEGCERVEVYRPIQDENSLVPIERWRSSDAYEKYQEWRAGTGVKETLRALMADPPVVHQLSAVDV